MYPFLPTQVGLYLYPLGIQQVVAEVSDRVAVGGGHLGVIRFPAPTLYDMGPVLFELGKSRFPPVRDLAKVPVTPLAFLSPASRRNWRSWEIRARIRVPVTFAPAFCFARMRRYRCLLTKRKEDLATPRTIALEWGSISSGHNVTGGANRRASFFMPSPI